MCIHYQRILLLRKRKAYHLGDEVRCKTGCDWCNGERRRITAFYFVIWSVIGALTDAQIRSIFPCLSLSLSLSRTFRFKLSRRSVYCTTLSCAVCDSFLFLCVELCVFMAPKRAASSKAGTEPKRKRRMMMIAEKVKLLDILKKGRTYAAVASHFSVNESVVRYIKKDEANIRKTVAIFFNKSAMSVVMVCNKTIIRMEAALAVWIADCRKDNIALDTNIVKTKARSLYETFAAKELEDDSGDHEEDDVEHPQPGTSSDSQPKKPPFTASKKAVC
ncbi:unnamed protein product [Acanthosepion pharaonis]|uniref:HTH psq-type domain-containing protein n=1 Tax=Acanthosepion pharaonis TaxID=158019 RepID=A0A812BW49_ACAPH|nr:unnamed protein product [Sepia pharaonis]